ncbi:MAG: hypothetical protein LBU48_02790, partial [Coriobacteriales bacterium]|nr:hypothetical protein [Coriobacteriales bacterium]
MKNNALRALAIVLLLALAVSFSACTSTTGPGSGISAAAVSAGDPAYAQTYPSAQVVENPSGTELFGF